VKKLQATSSKLKAVDNVRRFLIRPQDSLHSENSESSLLDSVEKGFIGGFEGARCRVCGKFCNCGKFGMVFGG